MNETNAVLASVGASCGLNGEGSDFSISMMLACKAAEIFDTLAKNNPTIFTLKDWVSTDSSPGCRGPLV